MDFIELQIPTDEAIDFERMANAATIQYQSALARHMTGETVFVSIVIPITLTAVQVIVAYSIARRDAKKDQAPPELKIKINEKFIKEGDFSRTNVEIEIGQRIK